MPSPLSSGTCGRHLPLRYLPRLKAHDSKAVHKPHFTRNTLLRVRHRTASPLERSRAMRVHLAARSPDAMGLRHIAPRRRRQALLLRLSKTQGLGKNLCIGLHHFTHLDCHGKAPGKYVAGVALESEPRQPRPTETQRIPVPKSPCQPPLLHAPAAQKPEHLLKMSDS